ncbi:hypothetical protein DFP72DRAFT_1064065 [Ephemerocybe angulata]|uniref:Uncharacterized protein n=1 Tax=Ephemerocybe angulata TaxID=980116 RepID=A0A8H6I767_9AGAR|nr:hypothetical protein DFP72DRAFT_1064065 [Tulosesus angulatus]
MSREERVALLHEGVSDAATLSAFVEIVFDNSDNLFPTGHDEVVLRRTIGLEKDEDKMDHGGTQFSWNDEKDTRRRRSLTPNSIPPHVWKQLPCRRSH